MTQLKATGFGLCAVAVLGVSAMPPQAFGEQAEGEAGTIEEIVVTATRREETAQSVPIALTAVDREVLKNSRTDSFIDLANITVGLTATEASSGVSPYIRGVGTDTVTPGNDNPTAFYIDGVYYSDKTALAITGFSDVEQITVLRGPQGTLFGRNATAGAIIVNTLTPADEFTAEVEGTYGSDEWNTQAYVSGPLGEQVRASITGFYKDTDDYIDNLNPANDAGDKVGGGEFKGVRGKLVIDFSDTVSATVLADYTDLEDTSRMAVQPHPEGPPSTAELVAGAIGIPIPTTRDRRNYAGNVPPKTFSEAWGAALKLDVGFPAFDLSTTTAYRDTETGNNLDLDGSPIPILNFDSQWSTETFQQEILLTSNNEGPVTWVVGGFYLNQETGYDFSNIHIGLPWPATANDAANSPNPSAQFISNVAFIDIESIAVFAEGSYAFGNSTTLTLGVRYTDEESDLDSENRIDITTPAAALSFSAEFVCSVTPTCEETKADFDEVTYRVVLDHEFTDGVMGYVSYNRGFKSGVYNISTGNTVDPTEPELLDAFEIGLKSSFADGAVQLNAAAFYYDYSDLQVSVTDTTQGGTQRIVNAASAKISGLEADVRFLISDAFLLSLGVSTFFESDYDNFDNCNPLDNGVAGGTSLAVITTDCSDSWLPVAPDISFYVSGEYGVQLDNGSSITIGGVYSYVDEHILVPDPGNTTIPLPEHDSTSKLNLFARWDSADQRYYVKVWGDNLTGEDFQQSLFTTTFGYDTVWNREETWGLTVGARFGN